MDREAIFIPAENSKNEYVDYEIVDNQAYIAYGNTSGKLERTRQTGILFTRVKMYGLGFRRDASGNPISPFSYLSNAAKWREYVPLEDALNYVAFPQSYNLLSTFDGWHIDVRYYVYDSSTKEAIFDFTLHDGNDDEYWNNVAEGGNQITSRV